jgi:hypothetical protein
MLMVRYALITGVVLIGNSYPENRFDNWPIERYCMFESHKDRDLMKDDCKRAEWIRRCIARCKEKMDEKCPTS